MNILLFGGAFDPIHLGHQTVVNEVLALNEPGGSQSFADEIWYVPVKNHHFQKNMAAAEHRVAMLELILVPRTRIETHELTAPEGTINYTRDTLQALRNKHPEHTFSWMIGSDNLAAFDTWGGVDEMLTHHTFYVYPRKNVPMEPVFPGMVPLDGVTEIAVSSTAVREALIEGRDISQLVDPKVAAYIEEHALYGISDTNN